MVTAFSFRRLLAASALACLLHGCEGTLLGSSPENTPSSNFEILWRELDRYYPLFEVKQVDWDALHREFGEKIGPGTSSDSLWILLCTALERLDDPHVSLHDLKGQRFFNSGLPAFRGNYDPAVVRMRYLAPGWRLLGDGRLVVGRIRNSRIGYLAIHSFADGPDWSKDMGVFLDSARDLDAVVVDIRANGGGTTEAYQAVASAFVERPTTYMRWATRNGPGHTDFTSRQELSISPIKGRKPFLGSLALLVDGRTASSADHLHWIFKEFLPRTVTVGEPSCGVFGSISAFKTLPNGWRFAYTARIAWSLADLPLDQAGSLAPDSLVFNVPQRVVQGKDSALETAISLVGNPPRPLRSP